MYTYVSGRLFVGERKCNFLHNISGFEKGLVSYISTLGVEKVS